LSALRTQPEIAVAVPSHDRPLRLRWLLNALAEQTLSPERWEVIVSHDSSGPETEELLRTHPLALSGRLRSVPFPPGSAGPGRKRNAAWRAAQAPVIAFTDDDCRPPPGWLELALAAARRHPGAIIQGATAPDMEEVNIGLHASWVHTVSIWPPQPWGQTCNIVYPRAVLDATGGFPELMFGGEDTALVERARERGVDYVAATEVVTWHAIEETSLLGAVRMAWRWRDLPLLIRLHPRVRREFPMYFFYTRHHVWLPLAALGFWQMRRTRLASVLLVPYLAHALPRKYGSLPRGRIRAALELPGRVAIDLSEMAGLAWGSVKHRKLFL
jgi:glycosyltransferase involved in cell wall biosynthesis